MRDTKVKYADTAVTCACGNTFTVQSNKKELHIESCDKCHSAYTGKTSNKAAAGRIEKFNRKYGLNKAA
jgi:large subunit ribosomal protein L31